MIHFRYSMKNILHLISIDNLNINTGETENILVKGLKL